MKYPHFLPTIAIALLSLSPTARSAPPAGPDLAPRLEREVQRISAEHAGGAALWPGYDPLAVPLAVFDGARTALFRHPSPPAGFVPAPEGPAEMTVIPGRHEAITANTSAELGGVPTATIMLDQTAADRPLTDLAAIAIHEGFHVWQRTHHPGWIANEADAFVYPAERGDLLALGRLEMDALRRALASLDDSLAAGWARKALALRSERYAAMDSTFAAYERGTELNEGLATYVEMRAAGRSTLTPPAAEFGPAQLRLRAYSTGAALALLLDRFAPGWPRSFEANDRQTLDGALTQSLGKGAITAFDAATTTAAQDRATADAVAFIAARTRRRSEFFALPGWRIIVVPARSSPLWAQGFDPLNVERLDGAQLLHGRYLALGNDAGKLEVLDATALTEGVGPHPLFQGVRRVEVAGLPEPRVTTTEGQVKIDAAGLTLELRGAHVAQSDHVITVRLD